MRRKHQKRHGKSNNYSQSHFQKPRNRSLGWAAIDFDQDDDGERHSSQASGFVKRQYAAKKRQRVTESP